MAGGREVFVVLRPGRRSGRVGIPVVCVPDLSEGAGKQVSFLDTGQSLHGCIDEIPSDRTEEAIANDVARANSCGDVDPVLAISGVSTGIESDDAKEDGSCGVDRRMCSAGDRLLG